MADPSDVVREYFGRVEAGREDVADLFTEDAQLVGLGMIVNGRPAVGDFYADIIASAGPSPEVVEPLLAEGNRVAAEIIVSVEGVPVSHVIDLFEFEGDRIRRLTYFVADTGSSALR